VLAESISPDVRTCLGMAYAMNHEVCKSMDVLELTDQLDGSHFSRNSNTRNCSILPPAFSTCLNGESNPFETEDL
jgi:hypothetical protein